MKMKRGVGFGRRIGPTDEMRQRMERSMIASVGIFHPLATGTRTNWTARFPSRFEMKPRVAVGNRMVLTDEMGQRIGGSTIASVGTFHPLAKTPAN